MISLALAAAFFVAIHLGLSGTRLRDAAVARLGLSAYMVAFSVASVAAMVWLIYAYNMAPYVMTWGQWQAWKPFAVVLMLPAFVLVVAGLTTPNPTAVAQEQAVSRAPSGIVRISRHPFLMGVALWAAIHLIGNGDVASLLFFASLAIVAMAGTVSIDAKRRRALGSAAWDRFASRTSILPFAAILAGRNRVSAAEIGWWRPAAGVLAYALLLGAHAHVFGVSPFPG
jgi:uncharacterized membrane protein